MSHKILLVMPPQRRQKLANFLSHNGLDVLSVGGTEEAMQMLAQRDHYDLVFADADLEDGSWRDLIPVAMFSEIPCEMIVCSRIGEEHLWAEVLQSGAYDLIAEPYENPETLRIIHSALDNHYMRRLKTSLQAMAS